ncbi:MAG: putative molybdenum carrier protein [Planctomycetaceae bacterium]|nr:putative molybdenum carrier protein [Planctomycetaceae bacterium]
MAARTDKAWRLEKVVSGGQTGVDRAALDVALELSISCGGWCPKGRRAEDGAIPEKYLLHESPTSNYAERTALNVKDSDGTLILSRGPLRGGTALTKTFAERYGRPCLVIDLRIATVQEVTNWLMAKSIRVLNVAGPRESSQPGIARSAAAFLRVVFGNTSPTRKRGTAAKGPRPRVGLV